MSNRKQREYADILFQIKMADTSLNLDSNKLKNMPGEIRAKKNLVSLYLNDNKLKNLPDWFGEALKKKLQILQLASNQLTSLPTSFYSLKYLTDLDLSDNQLTTLSSDIKNLRKLKTLDVSENNLNSLPNELGRLKHLTTLNIQLNPNLRAIPPSLGLLKKLELITDHPRLDEKFEALKRLPEVMERIRLNRERDMMSIKGKEVTETADWMEYCRSLNQAYGINELRQITAEIGLDVRNNDGGMKSKRELCAQLAQSYDDYLSSQTDERQTLVERNCHNGPFLAEVESYNQLRDQEVIEFEEGGKKYCFSLDELDGLLRSGDQPQNPFTREVLPVTRLREQLEAKKRALDELEEQDDPRTKVHELQIRRISPRAKRQESLRQIFEMLHSEYPYLPENLLRDLDRTGLTDLYDYLQRLGYDLDFARFRRSVQEDIEAGLHELLTQLIITVNKRSDLDLKIVAQALETYLQQQSIDDS